MKPEFLGIYHLYLDSKILAWRAVSAILLLSVTMLISYLAGYTYRLQELNKRVANGDTVNCSSDALAKIVENGKVTCVMARRAPGQSVYNKVIKDENYEIPKH